jgi:hypothetical protein
MVAGPQLQKILTNHELSPRQRQEALSHVERDTERILQVLLDIFILLLVLSSIQKHVFKGSVKENKNYKRQKTTAGDTEPHFAGFAGVTN